MYQRSVRLSCSKIKQPGEIFHGVARKRLEEFLGRYGREFRQSRLPVGAD
jgi:hypothetical protein